jgi:hypothetical protein
MDPRTPALGGTTRWGPAWLLLSIPVVTGAIVMWLGGASSALWSAHIAAGVVGVLAYAAVTRMWQPPFTAMAATAVVGTLTVLATLLGPGLEGVDRWLVLGPVRLHASAFVMPALLVFAAGYRRSSPTLVPSLLVAVQGVHLLQPDAGQATAVAAASVVLLIGDSSRNSARLCALLSVATAAATWARADPLSSAPFVEDILGRAFDISPWTGGLALASLAPMIAAPLAARGKSISAAATSAAAALTVYFATSFLVTAFGQFPVPLLGFGASPVIGAFVGVALLNWGRG